MSKSRTRVVTNAPELPSDLAFEAALIELETLVARMEGGMALLRHCQGQLAAAEEKIRVMDGVDEGQTT